MASHRLIHLAVMRKERSVLATNPKQKASNSFTFGSNPSIGHEFWRLSKVRELRFLLVATSEVARLFE